MKYLVYCLSFMLFLSLIASCGGGGGGSPSSPASQTVSGVAAAGSPIVGTAALKDSSTPSKQLTTTIASDGSFSFDVTGLTAPYLLQAVGTAAGRNYTLYSFVTSTGTGNINPLTDLAVTMANGGQSPSALFSAPSQTGIHTVAAALPTALANIQSQLAPLFNQVGASPSNIITDKYTANHQGMDMLFDQAAITVSNGSLSITNRSNGASILPSTPITAGIISGTPNVSMLSVYTISGSVKTSAGTAISGATVTLTGSNSTTATTDSSGNFTFSGAVNGSYTLSAALSGYTFSPTSIPVTVNNANSTGQNIIGTVSSVSLVSIAITPANTSLSIGNTQQFNALGTYSDNSIKDLTGLVTWSVSNTSVATISTSGLVTSKVAGSTTIWAKYGTVSGTTPLSVVVSTPTNYSYVTQWGTSGSSDGQFNHPNGVAVDSSGNIYIADSWNQRIQKFSSSGAYITKWGGYGIGNGLFNGDPTGVAIDNSGNVYVSVDSSYRILKFSINGTYITEWGDLGSGNGQLGTSGSSGIAVDKNGNVYVSDTTNCRIQEFSSSGTYITQWSTSNLSPAGVAIDGTGSTVYAVLAPGFNVKEFSISGTLISNWGSFGSGNKQFSNPSGVAVDNSGNVYVADTGNNRIQKFSNNGTYITQWGTLGSGNGQFNMPTGVAVDSTGNVYVVDKGNSRIQKFAPN
jgi:sugar lactone lactonase YvrE